MQSGFWKERMTKNSSQFSVLSSQFYEGQLGTEN